MVTEKIAICQISSVCSFLCLNLLLHLLTQAKNSEKNWHNEAVMSSWCSDASPFLGHLDTSGAEEAEDTGDGHNVSMILGLHLREECLHCLRHTNTHAAVYFKATNCHLYMT